MRAPYLLLAATLFWGATATAQTRTWNFMPTGNGYGFQIFDRAENKITSFLEHPYRYVAPGDDGRTYGIGRRDLAHDIYFGARVGGNSTWITDYSLIEYEAETNVIHGRKSFNGATLDTYYFAPYGYAGNGMVMLIRAKNDGGAPLNVSFFAKPNFGMGNGRVDPGNDGENLRWITGGNGDHFEETGPGGGHGIYLPIGGISHASCGADSDLYNTVLGGGGIGDTHTCNGTNQVPVLQQDFTIPAGGEAWWGAAILFLNDNPNDGRANLFRDPRTIDNILTLWSNYLANRGPKELHDSVLAEWETWRKNEMPTQLTENERRLWRQSEAILRQGQVLEYDRKNKGMMLASLPPGEWHTGWVRDGLYAVVAYSMTGHDEEARIALDFFTGADGGFFDEPNYLNRRYRVSVCRYFGNGMEEGDFNQDGPNIETDGFGLVLWAARLYLHYSCDLAWLDQPSWQGDTNFEALHHIAQDIEALIVGDLAGADASIWEVHWNRRQVFAYTVATHTRGLFDFAAIARVYGREDLADKYQAMAQRMLDAAKVALVHQPTQSFASHTGVAGNDVHVDGSAVGFMDWHLIEPDDPLYVGTLTQFSKLTTGFGGYRRLEPNLSLTGEGGANTYDLAEWILLDLRIGDAWRRAGYALNQGSYINTAETLLNKVTSQAMVNDLLVPELFEPNNGRYTGVVPMVGYGAGAWMMSQLEKYGAGSPRHDIGFGHCTDPCFNNPCTETNKTQCVVAGASFTCACDPGYHDESGTCAVDVTCSETTCGGHGTCDDSNGITCTCEQGYSGTSCSDCAQGYRLEAGACIALGGDMMMPGETPTASFNDGPASLCNSAGESGLVDFTVLMSIVFLSIALERLRRKK